MTRTNKTVESPRKCEDVADDVPNVKGGMQQIDEMASEYW